MRSRTAALTALVDGWSSSTLHAVACSLRAKWIQGEMSQGQEFLWNLCVAELEQRRREEPHPLRRCSCELCCSPFDDPELPLTYGDTDLEASLPSDPERTS
jgi:hypothetical protein